MRCHLNNTKTQKIILKAKNGGVPILPKIKYDAWWNHCKIGLVGAINNAKKYNTHNTINHHPMVYLSKVMPDAFLDLYVRLLAINKSSLVNKSIDFN